MRGALTMPTKAISPAEADRPDCRLRVAPDDM